MGTGEDTKKRTRSPAYPAIDLGEALGYAARIYKEEDRHTFTPEAAAVHWEYKPTSSAVGQIVSALKQFGLVIEEPGNALRQLRLSPLAMDLIVRQGGNPLDLHTAKLLKTAALNPKLHREIWEKYSGRLPSDATLKIYLVREREVPFNQDHVDSFISNLRSTIGFSKLCENDILLPADEDADSEAERIPMEKITPDANLGAVPRRDSANDKANPSTHGFTQAPPPAMIMDGSPFISFPLSAGNTVEIRLRQKVSSAEFETLRKLLELSQASLVDPDK